MRILKLLFISLILIFSCQTKKDEVVERKPIQFITLDPGHFHAALVQKTMYDQVDSTVYVYAPKGNDLQLHMDRIAAFNSRDENPTSWNEVVYAGDDFFEKLIAEKNGNVVILSGNNQKKTEYILQCLENGMNVYADKPMAINTNDFETLKKAFSVAKENQLLLYDVMTERFEITTVLQKELSQLEGIFGTLEKGTPEDPAITKESVHHLFKYVSGNILTRPAWFLDVQQEGEGIVDVMTHLVDMVQWESFPGVIIDYQNDIVINNATHWTTDITKDEFNAITKMKEYPDYLLPNVNEDSVLQVYCNGEINYSIKGVHAKTSVTWAYKAPEGTGDTHYSIMRGTKANLIIQQGEEENYQPTLYIQPIEINDPYIAEVIEQFKKVANKYPGLKLTDLGDRWKVEIPDSYKIGHEAHFGQVTENFLDYFENRTMPDWEVPNMIAKYYVTTKALEIANKK